MRDYKSRGLRLSLILGVWVVLAAASQPAERPTTGPAPVPEELTREYARDIRPLFERHCLRCHSHKKPEGDIDIEAFATLADVRKAVRTWQKIQEMLDSGQMPPKDAKQPTDAERVRLRGWVRAYLSFEARAQAGDPGPVVLRRLSNAEYNYTVQDLTGVDLRPTRQFPADGAAGEGFKNTGQALVMSPALLAKYLDAGKEIAAHAMFLPDGFRFSPHTTRRDWTNEILAQIRETYARYSDSQGASRVNLQGIVFDTNGGGRLPLEKYLAATLSEREALSTGTRSPATVARERGLSPQYMTVLWSTLNSDQRSALLDLVRARWRGAKPEDAAALAAEIGRWQGVLTRFQSVGHMKPWMVPANPLTTRQELRVKLPEPGSAKEHSLYLVCSDAGDGDAGDLVVWNQPRLVIPGHPDVLLRDVRDFTQELLVRRERIFAATANCLAAAAEAVAMPGPPNIPDLAKRHDVDPEILATWLDYLGIRADSQPRLDYFTQKLNSAGNYDFVKGWGRPETPNLVANSSDRHVRIPGNMKPHGLCVHPSPTLNAAVGWRSPIAGPVRIAGKVTHAHPECGNGVTWSLELRRGAIRQRLAADTARGAMSSPFSIDQVVVQQGDLISLLIGPRDGNHACDLTDLELVIRQPAAGGKEWNLCGDVTDDVLAGNPHPDRLGNREVWHFYTEPVTESQAAGMIPADSVLARWLTAEKPEEKQRLADQLRRLLTDGPPANAPAGDAALYRQLAAAGGPLLAKARTQGAPLPQPMQAGGKPAAGLDPAMFGKPLQGHAIDAASLGVAAGTVIEVRLPADLFRGAEFAATVTLHPQAGSQGSVQPQVLTSKPGPQVGIRPELPVLVSDTDAARKRWEGAFEDFRRVFPAALCYTKIVPVDEVVTLTLFHREDEAFARLMLDEMERARLDRLWDELHFVSHDAFTLVDAFNQLMEYATQDSNPKLFEPFRKPIHDRAAAFRQALSAAEPRQLDAVVEFAARAYRRPLSADEGQELRSLHARLREQGLPHDEAVRLVLARVFVSPAFLYRLEKAPPGPHPGKVTDWELASRLSYFLWSSLPDDELRELAARGSLQNPEVLNKETRRMLGNARVRRLAIEFACHWVHIADFDTLDEKSERHFPTFSGLRRDMYEESIRFFTDLFQRDRSVLSILDADHTFLNEALARHYGIPGVTGTEWRRVDGVRQHGRGGILGFSTTLAKQSGASRTSPILRGNWVSEVLLGEKLPRPPRDVPRLPEEETATDGLTVRQLIEKHSKDDRCAVCHARIDPLGFALEGYDAIGRRRDRDLANRPIMTRTRTQDGAELAGLEGLREYLLTKRRDAFLRQFCRKLLGYALGRGVQLSDEPLLEEMQNQLRKNDYRFSAAIETIVTSRQFREIRGQDAPSEP